MIENRLISVTVNSQVTLFTYDGDGNLVKKTKPDGSRTIYVGGTYEVEKSSGGAVTHTITNYPAGGAMKIDNTLSYILKDHLGSASAVTDSTGITVGEERFYPFGQTRIIIGSMYTDRLYTGQREITGLGIYHYGARFYSPYINHFLSADSIIPDQTNPQDLNRYSYVDNNPMRYTDPTGHVRVGDNDVEKNKASMSCSKNPEYCKNGKPMTKEELKAVWDKKHNKPKPTAVATMATVLDTAAAGLNGVYAVAGDAVMLVCPECGLPVLAAYQYYSYIPNSISTVAMALWIMEGASTGENDLRISQSSRGTHISISLSQDTLIAAGTNLAGWTVLREPNTAFLVDAGVAGYDYARMGAIPFTDYTLPAFINPTFEYHTGTGFDFAWHK